MRVLLAILLVVAAWPGLAQPVAPAKEATVTLLHRPVAVFRAPLYGLTPAERAQRAQVAIDQLLERGGPGVVSVQPETQGNLVMIDGSLALTLTAQDADTLRGETLDAATRSAVAALARVIAETREARDRRRLAEALALSAAATLAYVLLSWGVLRLRDRLYARTLAWTDTAPGPSGEVRRTIWQSGRLQLLAQWILRVASWVFLIAFTYEWLVFVLLRFPRTRVAGEHLGGFVLDLAGSIGDGMLGALPDLVVAVAIFFLARFATLLLRPVFERAEQGAGQFGWLDRDLARPTRRLVDLGIWLFAVVMAYPYLPGSQSEAFKGMSVLVGLMITLGGSSLVNQAASGLILMYSRTLRVGEYVRVGGTEGTVVEMGSFTTRIRTGLGEEVTLPNAMVMGSTVSNFSRAVKGAGYILDAGVTIGYDTPWREVEEMLLEAARRTPGVLPDPAPRVLQRALADFYVDYRLVAQAVPETARARAETLHFLHANILDVFNEHGVQVMSPHYQVDPPQPKVVHADDPYAAPTGGARPVRVHPRPGPSDPP
jgi:small-conductance mechanosensitive channel